MLACLCAYSHTQFSIRKQPSSDHTAQTHHVCILLPSHSLLLFCQVCTATTPPNQHQHNTTTHKQPAMAQAAMRQLLCSITRTLGTSSSNAVYCGSGLVSAGPAIAAPVAAASLSHGSNSSRRGLHNHAGRLTNPWDEVRCVVCLGLAGRGQKHTRCCCRPCVVYPCTSLSVC